MSQNNRILIGVVIILAVVGIVLGIDWFQRRGQEGTTVEVPPGAIPIHVDGGLIGAVISDDLAQLEEASFIDQEEGKTQEGWLLRDVILLHVGEADLSPETLVTVSSSSRGKSAQLSWAEVNNTDNMVMFDVSGRGTLKLVSKLERLDVRDEWVQDVDRIEVNAP